jgi:hypothetical protein
MAGVRRTRVKAQSEMRGQGDRDEISKAIIATRVRGLIVVLDLVTIRAAPSLSPSLPRFATG